MLIIYPVIFGSFLASQLLGTKKTPQHSLVIHFLFIFDGPIMFALFCWLSVIVNFPNFHHQSHKKIGDASNFLHPLSARPQILNDFNPLVPLDRR